MQYNFQCLADGIRIITLNKIGKIYMQICVFYNILMEERLLYLPRSASNALLRDVTAYPYALPILGATAPSIPPSPNDAPGYNLSGMRAESRQARFRSH